MQVCQHFGPGNGRRSLGRGPRTPALMTCRIRPVAPSHDKHVQACRNVAGLSGILGEEISTWSYASLVPRNQNVICLRTAPSTDWFIA